MEFGSKFVLSKPSHPAVDVEEIDGAECYAGGHADAREGDVCFLKILDTVCTGDECDFSLIITNTTGGVEGAVHSRGEKYVRKASAFVIVFSVADRESFQEAKAIYSFCCRLKRKSSVPAVLCANKCDLSRDGIHAALTSDALQWADSHGITMFSTSARLRINIEEAFIKLVQVSPRKSDDYNIIVLGAKGVGKSLITRQFALSVWDPSVHEFYRRQIAVPGLPPLRKNGHIISALEAAKRCFASFFHFGSSSSQVLSPRLPTYDEATGIAPENPVVFRNIRQIPKVDTNVIMLNLNVLEPEYFDMLATHTVQLGRIACPSCSAAISASSACAVCDMYNLNAAQEQLKIVKPTKEPAHLEISKFLSSQSKGRHISSGDSGGSEGLVVFCVDISESMSDVPRMQSRATPLNQATEPLLYVNSLQCMKNEVQKRLNRLERNHPGRKVAIIAFSDELELFVGGTRMSPIDPKHFKRIHDAMNAVRTVCPVKWKAIRESAQIMREYIKSLTTRKGGTALGPALALALGLAHGYKRETGGTTEIFLCTDGASNIGIGCTTSEIRQRLDPNIHGRAFYAQAGEIALSHSAKINIICMESEAVALEIIEAASRPYGVVTTVQTGGGHRQARTHRRVIGRDVTIKLHLTDGWTFVNDPRPNVTVNRNILTCTLAQIDDETTVGFGFKTQDAALTAAKGDMVIRAQMKYTPTSTGTEIVKVFDRGTLVTTDRDVVETMVDVGVIGAYTLQRVAFATNQAVKGASCPGKDIKPELRRLRDELHGTNILLMRGANTAKQQRELANFARERRQLDQVLKDLLNGSVNRNR